MEIAFGQVHADLRDWAAARGMAVYESQLSLDKAGEFDGTSAMVNAAFAAENHVYYLARALGSIILWSLGKDAVQAMFDELHVAKEHKAVQAERLQRAINRYRDFEMESSELAVGILEELDHPEAIDSYSNFMRADLEAMTQAHHDAKAPVWHSFFARWNEEVARGQRVIEPFPAKDIARFKPIKIKRQEILQKQDWS